MGTPKIPEWSPLAINGKVSMRVLQNARYSLYMLRGFSHPQRAFLF